MDNHLRVYITGPGYRASISAHSYVVMYTEEQNKVLLTVISGDDQYTLDVTEPDHSKPFSVSVENLVSMQTTNFTLDSFFPQAPKVPDPRAVLPV